MRKDIRFLGIRLAHGPTDDQIQTWFYMNGFDTMLDEDDSYVFYCEEAVWTEELKSDLRDYLALHQGTLISEEIVEQRNWNEEWEQSIEPVLVADAFLIHPSWHEVAPAPGILPLVIDPKMSFGTGLHATTRLMLSLLLSTLHHGDRILDVGTGTGILAIAGILKGAREAVGVDIDEWSKDNAEENAERNGVLDRCRFLLGGIEVLPSGDRYDLILSNITRNDNLDLLPAFPALSQPGARLITSGYHADDRTALREAAEAQGYHFLSEVFEDEWAAAAFSLPS